MSMEILPQNTMCGADVLSSGVNGVYYELKSCIFVEDDVLCSSGSFFCIFTHDAKSKILKLVLSGFRG
jgi:hypothetical protein